MARLIEADALKAQFDERYDDAFMQMHTRANIGHWESYSIGINWGRNTIADAPTVDAVEVVRCKDCKNYNVYRLECHNGHMNGYIGMDGFCSYGERRTNAID